MLLENKLYGLDKSSLLKASGGVKVELNGSAPRGGRRDGEGRGPVSRVMCGQPKLPCLSFICAAGCPAR